MVTPIRTARPWSGRNRVRDMAGANSSGDSAGDEALVAEQLADVRDAGVGVGQDDVGRLERVVRQRLRAGADGLDERAEGLPEPALVPARHRVGERGVELVELVD